MYKKSNPGIILIFIQPKRKHLKLMKCFRFLQKMDYLENLCGDTKEKIHVIRVLIICKD